VIKIKKGVFIQKYSDNEKNLGICFSKMLLPIESMVSQKTTNTHSGSKMVISTYKYDLKPIYYIRLSLLKFFLIIGGWYDNVEK